MVHHSTFLDDLQSCLENWIQAHYGAPVALRAVAIANPPAAVLSLERTSPRLHAGEVGGEVVWLSIAAGHRNTPTYVGIRALPNHNGDRDFELIEFFSKERIHRSFWCLDTFDAWQRAIDT